MDLTLRAGFAYGMLQPVRRVARKSPRWRFGRCCLCTIGQCGRRTRWTGSPGEQQSIHTLNEQRKGLMTALKARRAMSSFPSIFLFLRKSKKSKNQSASPGCRTIDGRNHWDSEQADLWSYAPRMELQVFEMTFDAHRLVRRFRHYSSRALRILACGNVDRIQFGSQPNHLSGLADHHARLWVPMNNTEVA